MLGVCSVWGLQERKEEEAKHRDLGAGERHARLTGAQNRPHICGKEVECLGTRRWEMRAPRDG